MTSTWLHAPSEFYDPWTKKGNIETAKERHGRLRTGGRHPTTMFGRVIFSSEFEMVGGFVVFINFLIMTMETNANAVSDGSVLEFVKHANRLLLAWYCFECFSRLYILRMNFFCGPWNLLDFLIVVIGILSEVIEDSTVNNKANNLKEVAMLKSLRMLRLLRLVRLLVAFRELYVLVVGIARCMKTLFWASLLIFLVLNVWSILSVEYLRTLTEDLGDQGSFGQCDWCRDAFSTIWLANLTWFQIITGDGWSTLGRPLVEEHYWPYLFFLSSIFIIVWGLLNLIVAAIVDVNIAAREDDVASAARLAKQSMAEAWASFQQVCKEMDADGSGTISISEFKAFCHESEELKSYLITMGISEMDLDALLDIMDTDRSGRLENSEMVEQFTHMKTLVTKTTLYYLRRQADIQASDLAGMKSSVNCLLEEVRALSSMSDNAPPNPSCLPLLENEAVDAERQSNLCCEASLLQSHCRVEANVSESIPPALPTASFLKPSSNSKTCATLQTLRQYVSPTSEAQNKGNTALGWYYYGSGPPADVVAKWDWANSLGRDTSSMLEKTRDLQV